MMSEVIPSIVIDQAWRVDVVSTLIEYSNRCQGKSSGKAHLGVR